MASTIKVKRSAVSGNAPTTSNIAAGELALNTADGILYSSDGSSVFEIGANLSTLAVDTDTLYVDAVNNRVGIGTTSPNQLLAVGGSASGTIVIQVTNSTAGTAFNDGMQMFINDTAGGLNMREAYPLQFYVNGSERVRISSSGNVGIGTTSPGSLLTVDTGTNGLIDHGLGGDYPAITYRNGSGAWFHAGKHPSSDYFYIGNGATPTTTINLVIDSSGNVGIGTTSPSYDLHVVGDINFTGSIYQNGSVYSGSVWSTSGTDAYYTSGNVGIGTSSPLAKFNVSGGGSIVSGDGDYFAGGAYYNAGWKNSVSSQGGWVLRNTGGELAIQTAPANGAAGSALSMAERMRIDSSGNVGIGTSSPGEKLNVSTGGSEYAIQWNSTGSNNWVLASASNRAYIVNKSTPLEVLTILNGGNVGIGTNSPSEKLSIATDTDVSAEIGRAHVGYVGWADYAGFSHIDQNVGTGYALLQAANGTTYLNTPTGGSIRFRIANADKMVMSSTGLTIDGNAVWHAGNDGSGSGLDADTVDGIQGASFLRSDASDTYTGTLTMASTSKIVFPDVSSVPDSPTNEQYDYITFGTNGSISQVSGRGALLIASSDDSLVLANGDTGRNFTNSNISVGGEDIFLLSDNAVIIKTDLQEGWGTEWTYTFGNDGSLTVPGEIVAGSLTLADSDDSLVSDSTVSSWAYSKDFSVSAQDTEPRDISFSSDGTKMYILGNTGNDVNQYTLSTAWDVSTASYLQVFSVNSQEPSPYGLFFSSNGLNMYVVGSTSPDNVYRYTLSTAWNISTASYVSSFSVTAKDTDPQAVAFSSDGTKMYITGTSSDSVHQYNLSTAWDITTAVFSASYSVSAYSAAPQGLDFTSDGTKMYIIGSTYNRLIEYTLSTAWSVSTASFSGVVNCTLLGTYITNGCSGVHVEAGQNKAYIVDYASDRVFQLDTNIAATRFTGSKLLVDSDSHFEQDLLVYNNIHSNNYIYARNGIYSYNYGYVAGTLDVRGAIDLADSDILRLGSSDDIEIYHNGTHNYIDLNNGNLIIRDDGTAGDPTRFTFTRDGHIYVDTGNVGIGTSSPAVKLQIASSGSSYTTPDNNDLASIYVYNSNNASTNSHAILLLRTAGSAGGDPFISFDIAGEAGWALGIDNSDANKFKIGYSWMGPATNTRLTIDTSGNATFAGDVISSSDQRLKSNIEIIPNPIEKINKINGYTFTRTDKEDKEKRYAGVIAQEVREVLPEVVSENDEGYLSVSYGNMVSLLIEGIKEQQKEIDELKSLVQQLINKGE